LNVKLFGVNLCGAEFGGDALPGVLGHDYTYEFGAQFAYYRSKGLTLFRLPFRWERTQRWPFGSLDAYGLHRGLYAALDAAQQHGCQVLLEPHQYGRIYGATLTASRDDLLAVSDFWTEFANATAQHPAVYGYEVLGNEPHDQPGDPATTWRLDYEAAEAVRAVTDKPIIWAAPGWQSARYVRDNEAGFAWAGDANSSLGVHVYGDGDSSGTYRVPYASDIDQGWPRVPVSATTMADRLQFAVTWAAERDLNLMVTEFGVPGAPEWLAGLDGLLNRMSVEPNVLGGFAWAGGPWWPSDHPLTLEPLNGVDRPQLTLLASYAAKGGQ
jgi:endoglucanase